MKKNRRKFLTMTIGGLGLGLLEPIKAHPMIPAYKMEEMDQDVLKT